jgi:chemotaxis protein CheZ
MKEENLTKQDAGLYKDVSKITLQGLAGIARDFTVFYDELATRLQPALQDMASGELPEASDQLNAIVETTETATFRIMDSLEDMQTGQKRMRALLEEVNASNELNAKSRELITEAVSIMDTCQTEIMNIFQELSFQDLTGQRIKRIVTLVKSIEIKVDDILGALGDRIPSREQTVTTEAGHDNLLKGPQRTGQGMNQSAIDSLLAGL